MLKQEQISVPGYYIVYRKALTFLRTGRILHLFFLSSLVFFLLSFDRVEFQNFEFISGYGFLSLFFFSLCITTELDAYSRYQNYKMAKDLYHQHGFRELITKPFSKSSCQRDAASEAARQIGISEQVDSYFYKLGFRWYHIVPSMLIESPLMFFTRMYWLSTFFVPRYKSKYFCW